MIRTVYDCDGCPAKELPQPVVLSVRTGSQMDGAGSTDQIWENLHLCTKCLIAAATFLVNDNEETARALVKYIKRKTR